MPDAGRVLKIELPERAESALSRLAIEQRRDLRRQAEFLVLEGLRRRRLIEGDRAGRVATAAQLRETR